MKLRLISESASQGYSIVPWSDEAEDYDPWVTLDQAERAAKASGIRISSNKEIRLIAVTPGGDAIGGVWVAIDEDEGHSVYDFDVAVDPKYRDGRVGLKLIDAAIRDFQDLDIDMIRVWVINPRLVKYLENHRGFDVETEYGDGSAHMTLYR